MISERPARYASGYAMLLLSLLGLAASVYLFIQVEEQGAPALVAAILLVLGSVLGLIGLFVVNPNQYKVLQLFGAYSGTAKAPGLKWANPFYSKHSVSVRIRNFETGKLKVNDQRGNPVEIGAVVVWKVVDTAEALFEVNDYEDFVHVQSESALRGLATGYPYDSHTEGEKSLVGDLDEISQKLCGQIQDRLKKAGVDVLEARISHLAYSPEIAAAMLRRQQASAVVAARQQIVEGAVGMVETALARLSQKNVIELDEDRKAVMVSNLMVVLCSDHDAQPVINAGTLHQ